MPATHDKPLPPAAHSDPLRVLTLTDHYPNPLYPQWSSFNRQQLGALSERCQLRLVVPVPWIQLLAKGRLFLPPRQQPFPVDWPVFWYVPRVLSGWQGRAFFHSSWPCLRRGARALRPQLLFTTCLFPGGWAGMTAARRLGLPLVIKLHGSDLMVFKDDPARLPYLRQALAAADEVVAVSRALAQEARAQGASSVTVVPNGLDRERFAPGDKASARAELGLPAQDKLLVFVGSLRPVKGPDLALEALPRLPQATLVMVGAGELEETLQARAAELGVASRVIWAGPQPHQKVPRYLAASDALLLPSRSEGDPNAVLEALGCGRPVVAARVGGVPQAVSEELNGAIFPPEDVAAMAEAAQRVLARDWDPDQVAATVAGRSWRQSAGQLHEVLARAAGKAAA
ncbi:MAG: glycosyltransferase [Desulfarculaceae bacterium]|nr:glycosyltransferase [Desulfarculaceae bacterium]MCF8073997.1 glycosyltransferase [Desulfarculaceae bacterium]MCF8102683.1 glycosyltransferase [Desulfarculaceae bacterium]MCF8116076.1 glycosyltransferase [Desulfarculaceae bacterium]